MEIKIREATFSEINIIVDFQVRMSIETENVFLEHEVVYKGVKAVFEDKTKGQYWIAEVNKNIIASMLITPEWSDWRNKTVLWFQSVYVIPNYRKKSVFKMMYLKLKNIVLESEDYAGLRLYVDRTNTKAQKVYEKLGMSGEHYFFYEWME